MSNIHPTTDQLIELFIAFLASHGAKDEWFNVAVRPQELFIEETPNTWIGEAFMWHSTPSGYTYWDLLDVQWQEELAKPITNQSN